MLSATALSSSSTAVCLFLERGHRSRNFTRLGKSSGDTMRDTVDLSGFATEVGTNNADLLACDTKQMTLAPDQQTV